MRSLMVMWLGVMVSACRPAPEPLRPLNPTFTCGELMTKVAVPYLEISLEDRNRYEESCGLACAAFNQDDCYFGAALAELRGDLGTAVRRNSQGCAMGGLNPLRERMCSWLIGHAEEVATYSAQDGTNYGVHDESNPSTGWETYGGSGGEPGEPTHGSGSITLAECQDTYQWICSILEAEIYGNGGGADQGMDLDASTAHCVTEAETQIEACAGFACGRDFYWCVHTTTTQAGIEACVAATASCPE